MIGPSEKEEENERRTCIKLVPFHSDFINPQ
jgi:hypothetical protein